MQLAYNNHIGPQAVLPAKYDTGCSIATVLTELLLELGLA